MRREPPALTIREKARRAIEGHARGEWPRECCGVLLGIPGTDSAAGGAASIETIVDAVPVQNIAGDPNRYFLDPKGHVDARRHARERGLQVLGFYHSHPHSIPVPSPLDIEEATYDGSLHVIVGLAGHRAEVRAYRLEGGNFLELPLVTGP